VDHVAEGCGCSCTQVVISLPVKTSEEAGCYTRHVVVIGVIDCVMVALKQWSELLLRRTILESRASRCYGH
jgi:hypothetical protein